MERDELIYAYTLKELLYPIQPFLDDDEVSEVLINGPQDIYIEKRGRLQKADGIAFDSADDLTAALRAVAQYVGKRLTEDQLIVEARLPSGARVQVVQAPAARAGACVAIRKFSKKKLAIEDLVTSGSLTGDAAAYLTSAVRSARNIIISGGTGSGKTTLLNCLSGRIDDHERILVLEDASELQLQKQHVVYLETKQPDKHGRGGATIRDLFRACLRLRPDRIVVGECRGSEALDMIQAMTSGHGGSMSTLHANTPYDALNRLETMALMANANIPLYALRSQVASAIDLIVQISRLHSGQRRVTYISEVLPLTDDGRYRIRDHFLLSAENKEGNQVLERRSPES